MRKCLCCNSAAADVVPYLDLGTQPLANAYRAAGDVAPEPAYPLGVAYCPACYHSQLTHAVDPAAMFGHYLYVSGTTQTFRDHCADLTREALLWPDVRDGAPSRPADMRVLDVACNDGTLLEAFRAIGASVRGIDPAANLRPVTAAKGLEVDVAYFGEDWARAHDGRYDVVTATNVLAHVPDPAGFLRAAERLLRPGGVVVVEFPYGAETIERCEFDQVYHEHHGYFTAHSFETLVFRATRLSIVAVERTPIHGGSARFTLGQGEPRGHCEAMWAMTAHERAVGVLDGSAYRLYQRRVDFNRDNLLRVLCQYRRHALVAYGASAKGNTLMNYAGVTPDLVVDDNPLKQGLVTPGRRAPIAGPDVLASIGGPVAFLLTAWNFRDEVLRRIRAARGPGRGDVAITYVPRVEVVQL